MSDTPPQRSRRRLTVVDVIGILGLAAIVLTGVIIIAMHAGDPAAANGSSSSTSTAASAADTERAVIDACHRSIIERAADDSALRDSVFEWESSVADHTATGRYEITGTTVARYKTLRWHYSYTCTVIAEQAGDGSGGWVAVDNGFAQS